MLSASRACCRIAASIAASPFERVGERCFASPIASMYFGSVARISAAERPEYTRSSSAISPDTIAESLVAHLLALEGAGAVEQLEQAERALHAKGAYVA